MDDRRLPETCGRCGSWACHRTEPCGCPEVPAPGYSPVHEFFGLTYASYLVLPRSVMQSMPAAWQAKMVDLLTECEDRLGHHYEANQYRVRLIEGKRPVPDPLSDYRHLTLEPRTTG